MVIVRLSRAGCKKRPYYHIVVTDKQNARDGRFIEQIGTYDPTLPVASARVNYERLDYWVGVGAQLSERVLKVTKDHKKTLAASA
jgi:small subunit ribosomal protein S16